MSDLYDSVWIDKTITKESVNIEDIRSDTALSTKAENWMLTLVGKQYVSKEEYEEAYRTTCKKYDVVPKNRLDINLIYWRLLGEGLFPRNKSFEKYSVQDMPDMEDLAGKVESDEERAERVKLENFVKALVAEDFCDKAGFERCMRKTRRQFHIGPSKVKMQTAYKRLVRQGAIKPSQPFEALAIKKGVRSESGVLVVTVLTSPYPEGSEGKPGRFDCAYDCAYCPSEPGMPRSYISTEPAVRRAIQNNWDPIEQFKDRVSMLGDCGHTVDKIEVLVLGGTWSSYPMEYRENFIRDLFYAANTGAFLPPGMREEREKRTLLEERRINETTKFKIIGVTLETRPDCINTKEIRHLRDCGCTRVQLGVQHTNDAVLKKIKRACTRKHNVRGIRLLKEAGFKVDIHLMPDLPGSSVEIDNEMFDDVLYSPDLQVDQWKIYPTSVVRHSQIEKWYDEGSYIPYADEDHGMKLLEVVIRVKSLVHPWIRLNRVIRDIPAISILGGNDDTNMRQKIAGIMKDRGLACDCIRCREVRGKATAKDIAEAELIVRKYKANCGTEYFISIESPEAEQHTPSASPRRSSSIKFLVLGAGAVFANISYFLQLNIYFMLALNAVFVLYLFTRYSNQKKEDKQKGDDTGLLCTQPRRDIIYGFLRLRVNSDASQNVFDELKNCGLIRELHVYGLLISVSDKTEYKDRPQHSGFGKRLIDKAIEITKQTEGLHKIAVISGDGVKNYYRRYGFEDDGQYLTKSLKDESQ